MSRRRNFLKGEGLPPGVVDLTPPETPYRLIQPGALSGSGGPSEESLAREIVAIHGPDWRHDFGRARDFHFTGKRWEPDQSNRLFHVIGAHLRVASGGKPSMERASVARGVMAYVRANPSVAAPHELFDADPMLLGTPDGVVCLRSGKKRAASREDYITKLTPVSPKRGQPKRWLQFLMEAAGGDAEMVAYLQRVTGYFLTGSTVAHALFFLFGPGKNGKSVFQNIVKRALGDYAVTAGMDTFTASNSDRHPTDLARLDGARLVTASETEEGRRWAESRIKQLTGGDPIAARFMRQDFFEFVPQFKLLIAGNFQPQLHNVDEAMRRRFHMIPFVHTPAQPDMRLEEKLTAELPQILAWMIEGARLWGRYGLDKPTAVVDASDRYFDEQDMFGHWLTECCIVRPAATGRSGELFASWREFARRNGEESGAQKTMAETLRKRGFQPVRLSGGVRAWQGIELGRVFGGSDV